MFVERYREINVINHNKVKEKNCFNCANSFVDDNDKLHCMVDEKERIVEDDEFCKEWN